MVRLSTRHRISNIVRYLIMDNDQIKAKIQDFIGKNVLAVVSTIHTDMSGPESAVVGFAETHDFNIYFATSNTSRKFKNIEKNPNISLVIGWSGELGTVQYEGTASLVQQDERAVSIELLSKKNPYFAKVIATKTDTVVFKVKPRWIRFLDSSAKPQNIYELNF